MLGLRRTHAGSLLLRWSFLGSEVDREVFLFNSVITFSLQLLVNARPVIVGALGNPFSSQR